MLKKSLEGSPRDSFNRVSFKVCFAAVLHATEHPRGNFSKDSLSAAFYHFLRCRDQERKDLLTKTFVHITYGVNISDALASPTASLIM